MGRATSPSRVTHPSDDVATAHYYGATNPTGWWARGSRARVRSADSHWFVSREAFSFRRDRSSGCTRREAPEVKILSEATLETWVILRRLSYKKRGPSPRETSFNQEMKRQISSVMSGFIGKRVRVSRGGSSTEHTDTLIDSFDINKGSNEDETNHKAVKGSALDPKIFQWGILRGRKWRVD